MITEGLQGLFRSSVGCILFWFIIVGNGTGLPQQIPNGNFQKKESHLWLISNCHSNFLPGFLNDLSFSVEVGELDSGI